MELHVNFLALLIVGTKAEKIIYAFENIARKE